MNSFSMIHSVSMEMIIKCQIIRKNMHHPKSTLQSIIRRCLNIASFLLMMHRIYHTQVSFSNCFLQISFNWCLPGAQASGRQQTSSSR